MMQQRPRLALSLGDPAGIGPEVCLKAMLEPEVRALARCMLVGPAVAARMTARWLGLADPIIPVRAAAEIPDHGLPVLDVGELAAGEVKPGQLSAAAGRAAFEAVEAATRLALAGEVDAIVTAPLNKEALALAGVPYPGHTEILAALTGAKATMLLLSPQLRVVHVSVHVSLREAIERVRRDNVLAAIHCALEAAKQLGIAHPRVAVAGLNPHAGEGGLFGSEDRDEIAPAVAAAQAAGHDVSGPWPPDTVFLRASRGEWDFVVAMYHDQGHIPLKLFGLEGGVNVTLGLPILRTSVDHGTAFDIAGKGAAQHQSMVAAIRVAVQMIRARRTASSDRPG
jgi:4-hydroxythreonine-4-phosphate dehydrogenase